MPFSRCPLLPPPRVHLPAPSQRGPPVGHLLTSLSGPPASGTHRCHSSSRSHCTAELTSLSSSRSSPQTGPGSRWPGPLWRRRAEAARPLRAREPFTQGPPCMSLQSDSRQFNIRLVKLPSPEHPVTNHTNDTEQWPLQWQPLHLHPMGPTPSHQPHTPTLLHHPKNITHAPFWGPPLALHISPKEPSLSPQVLAPLLQECSVPWSHRYHRT